MAVPADGALDARYAFLAGLIDDAGQFPPAALPLETAVQRHAEDRRKRGWLVRRFLCPASRLDALHAALPPDADWRIGVVCDRSIDVDLAATAAFASKAQTAVVEAVETRLAGGDAGEIARICGELKRTLSPGVVVFLEVGLPDGATSVTRAVAAIAHARNADTWPGRALAAKVRCGGVGAGTAPPVDSVAHLLVTCVEAGVPLKATAGLHHPVRHVDAATGEPAHGFFNVAGAALLLSAGQITAGEVVYVLSESDPEAFSLTGEGFAWRDHALSPAQVAEGRAAAFTGFGSCSIDEPVDDLTALGVLPLEDL